MIARLLCRWLGCWWWNQNDGLPDAESGPRIGQVRCWRCGARVDDWREWV